MMICRRRADNARGGNVSERLVKDCSARTKGGSAILSIANDYRACLRQDRELTKVWLEAKKLLGRSRPSRGALTRLRSYVRPEFH
jgi:hypothetical protein